MRSLLIAALLATLTGCAGSDPPLDIRVMAVGFASTAAEEDPRLGRVAYSEDGGVSFAPAMPFGEDASEWITEAFVFDASRAFLLGNKGNVYRTTNGGNSFTRLAVANGFLDAIFFSDELTGYAAGGSFFLTTSDGGDTWVDPGSLPNFYFDRLHFRADGRGLGVEGFLAPRQGILYTSPDSGATWEQTLTTSAGLRALDFVSNDEAWIVGDDGQTVYTFDGGATWTPIDRPNSPNGNPPPDLNDIDFAAGVGWAVGSDGAVWRFRPTSGPEAKWQLGSAGDYDLRAVWAYDVNTAVAAGYQQFTDRGVVVRTRDGGSRWEEIHSEPGVFFYGIAGGLIRPP